MSEQAAPRPPESAPQVPSTPAARRPRRRIVLLAALLAALGAGGWFLYQYWTEGRFIVSTDDAYVGANIASIAPRIAGQVVEVAADSNQAVKAGAMLMRIDDADYKTALAQAQTRLATQDASLQRVKAQITVADAAIAQAQAMKGAADADVKRTTATWERVSKLSANDFASQQALDNARGDRDRALAQQANAQAGIASAQAQRQLVEAQMKEAEQTMHETQVLVDKARRDLTYTTILAPMDGVLSARSVQLGEIVSPGKRTFSLVPLASVYVDANLKETQVAKVRPGMKVLVKVDAYAKNTFEGVVESIAAGTGSTFSLLPPDNATGNFTKIVQRVPVRIRLTTPDIAAPLRAGMSVVADIDTRTGPTP